MNLIETFQAFALNVFSVTIVAYWLARLSEAAVEVGMDKSDPAWVRAPAWFFLIAIATIGAIAAKSWAMKGAALAIAGVLFAMGGAA